MSQKGQKRLGRTLNAYYKVKEAKPNGLHDVLEKTKLWRW